MSACKKTIIVDLTGVLFHLNKFRLLQFIGAIDVLRYVVWYRKNPVYNTLEILDAIARAESPLKPSITYKKYWQPACIKRWMSGEISSMDVAIELQQKIDAHYHNATTKKDLLEEKLAKKSLQALFSPEILLECFKPDIAAFKALKNHKKNSGCTIFLLSNFDQETFDLLKKRYPHLFNIFDHLFISADMGLLKPDPEIFRTVLASYNLHPNEVIFFDDHEENIIAAQQIGITSFLCTGAHDIQSALAHITH